MTIYPPIFLSNKYTKAYFDIIERRKSTSFDGYGEKHHIIPKALGGDNSNENIIRLTPREHFICHMLLVRMLKSVHKSKMISAVYMMIKKYQQSQGRITARSYALLREQYSHVASINAKAQKRKPHTDEWKAKVSAKLKGYDFGPEHAAKTIAVHTGRKQSDETKERLRQARSKQQIALKEWTLQKPNGEIITVTKLKEFCQANKLGLSKLLQTQETKKPVDNGYSTGWMILSVSGGHKKLI